MDKHKLLFILISASSIILLILLFVTALILRSSGRSTSEPAVIQQGNDFVTPTLAVIIPDGPASDESRLETNYPFELENAIPQELWIDVTDNSSDGYKSYDMTLSGDDSFSMIITTLSSNPEATSEERVKYNPPQYAYNTSDFIRIAVVNGQELYVSRSGGVALEVASEEGRLVDEPLSTTTEDDPVYVYQKYPFGLSEYISAFSVTGQNSPSYDNHTIIRYSISSAADAGKWPTYRELITETVSGLEKSP